MSSFKLIALRPLESGAPFIIKCLKAGTFYYLCNDYTIAYDGKSYKRRSENIAPLHDDFFIINDYEKAIGKVNKRYTRTTRDI